MFDSILPHLAAYRALINDCRTDNVAHCYIFCGTDTLLADRFTAESVYAILGGTTHNDALWRKTEGRTHADVLYFPRENKAFNKEEFETLMTEIGYAPIDGTRRVFVIDRAENMLPNVQNRLLKTLEEPQPGYVFLLKTTTLATLLPTVLSRSRVLELGALSFEDVLSGVKEAVAAEPPNKKGKGDPSPDEDAFRWAAQYADGSVTKARDLLTKPEYRGMCELAWDFLLRCDSSRDLIPWVNRLTGYDGKMEGAFAFFADALRDVAVYKTAGERAVLAKDRLPALRSICARYSVEAASASIDRVQTALKRLAAYDNKTSVADSFLFGVLEDRNRYPIKENL